MKVKAPVAIVTVVALLAILALAFIVWHNHEPMHKAHEAFESGDYIEVRRLIEPLANAGYFQAQRELALLYALGWGVERDDLLAKKWLKLSAAGLALVMGDEHTCKGTEMVFAADAYSLAKDMERLEEPEAAARWFGYAIQLGYDPKACPRK